jgi:hypothetical protein
MESSIFWDITLCSLLKVNQRFGGILQPWGWRLNIPENRQKILKTEAHQFRIMLPAGIDPIELDRFLNLLSALLQLLSVGPVL